MDNGDPLKSPSKPKQKRKPRKLIPLHTKKSIIADCESALQNNTKFREVAEKWEVNPQSVSHIWKHRDEIRSHLQTNPKAVTEKAIMTKRSPSLQLMEKMLISWIDEQISKSVSLTKLAICNQAKLLMENYDQVLKAETKNFQSSHGWIRNFFKRFGVKNITDLELPAKDIRDDESVDKFVSNLEKLIAKEKFRPEQIFNIDECGLNWRFLPTNKAPKEHFTMLIGTNAAADFKVKPMLINNRESPRALNHINKMTLPVTYRHNKSVCMTQEIFDNWFRRLFIPQVRQYHQIKGIENKILLIVDSVPVHRKLKDHASKKLKVVYVPPIVAHQVQPCVQSVESLLQVYYVRRLIKLAQESISTDEPKEQKEQVKEFWRTFDIHKAINIIDKVWQEDISFSTIVRSWEKIFPNNPTLPDDLELHPKIRGRLSDYFRPLEEPIVDDLVNFDDLEQAQIDEILAEGDSCPGFVDALHDNESQLSSSKHDQFAPSNGVSSSSSAYGSSVSASSNLEEEHVSGDEESHCSTDLLPSAVLLDNPDAKQSMKQLLGAERFHLLMQVLSLPVKHINLAKQLMTLVATTSNGKTIKIKRTPKTQELLAKLKEAYRLHMERQALDPEIVI